MPLYKYRCTACGHEVEVLEASHATDARTCKACGQKNMERLMAAFSVGSKAGGGACPTGTCPLS